MIGKGFHVTRLGHRCPWTVICHIKIILHKHGIQHIRWEPYIIMFSLVRCVCGFITGRIITHLSLTRYSGSYTRSTISSLSKNNIYVFPGYLHHIDISCPSYLSRCRNDTNTTSDSSGRYPSCTSQGVRSLIGVKRRCIVLIYIGRLTSTTSVQIYKPSIT